MPILHHHPLCPQSRFIRLVLSETGEDTALAEERAWERRREFLALDPAGRTPVFVEDGGVVVPGGGVIAEYLNDTRGEALGRLRLHGATAEARVEIRRLMEWFNSKFFEEVSGPLVHEKATRRFLAAGDGGGPPDMNVLRAARANIGYHLTYIGWLHAKRNWLAGDNITFADLAAAAHLSVCDYFGDVPWEQDETARHWYARMKSRPAMRIILAERPAGIRPPEHYSNPDF